MRNKKTWLVWQVACILSGVACAKGDDFKQGDGVTLSRDEPLYFKDTVYRQGTKGETFTVHSQNAATHKVFVITKDDKGQPIALNISEDAVAVTGGDEQTLRLLNGKVYRRFAVSRVEVDGPVIRTANGDGVKLFWTYLSVSDKERFQKIGAEEQQAAEAAKLLATITLKARVKPQAFHEKSFRAWIRPIVLKATAEGLYSSSSNEYLASIKDVEDEVGFDGTIEGKLPPEIGPEQSFILELYEIGRIDNLFRDRLFTTDRERAMHYLSDEKKK